MMRKILWTIAAMIVATLGVAIYYFANLERLFLDRAFVQLRGGRGSEPVALVKLASGESASVILEHDCCNGAGFDAVAIRASDGQELFAKKNYCGLEGFYSELTPEAVKDLPHFKAFLTAKGYQQR